MLPDLQIAAKYSQEETKSKYVVQFGLAPFAKDELSSDVQKTPYSKQYEWYLSFFSKKFRKIVTLYCGTLFAGHCTGDDLVDNFFESVRDLVLDFNLLLALGINGPNVIQSMPQNSPQSVKKEVPHTSWMLVHVLFT